MKQCSRCKLYLNESEFYVDNRKKDKLRIYCKECDSLKAKRYYSNNRIKRLAYGKCRRILGQKLIANLKINGCAICGYNKCSDALDFHHVEPKSKKIRIDITLINRKVERITEELNKCILLCANCHREIHNKMRHRK